MGYPPLYVTFLVWPYICPSVRLPVVHHISGTVHHLILIFGAHVQNDGISRCFFHFFKILVFWVVRRVKAQKMIQMTKKSVVLDISETIYHMIVIYGTHMENGNIWWCFFQFFKILIFWVVMGVKRAKNGPK